MKCAAYVIGNRLYAVGAKGPIPFSSSVEIAGDDNPQGILDLEDETLPESIKDGLKKMQENFSATVEMSAIENAMGDYIERDRQGDQNARAALILVGQNARKGLARAKVAYELAQKYIAAHPFHRVEIGDESPTKELEQSPILQSLAREAEGDGYALALATQLPSAPRSMATVMTLAHGPMLSQALIVDIAESFEDQCDGDAQLFLEGVESPDVSSKARELDEEQVVILSCGRVIRMARTIQAVCVGFWPEKSISNAVEWELGL